MKTVYIYEGTYKKDDKIIKKGLISYMVKWSNEWIIENAEDIFNQEFIDKIFNIFHKKYGIDKDDAWDLTVEVTDDIYKAIKNGDFKGSSEEEFWGYIKKIIRNAKNDFWKKHKLLPEPITEIFPDAEDRLLYSDIYRTPVDEYVINKEEFIRVINLLSENLTPAQWEVLKYTALEMTSPEIAKIVNKSKEAVRKLQERGRKSARKLFDGDPFDGFEF